ncbi:PP2C family protein-serine/threonine phosphatase [Nocardia sp. NPDC004068]|uniref:PP2C family protein-serine/threonine phosphatase n=1 Tax=Nocardia sp. NPDC004068 TaxID=3364303 RepID=UPI0036B8FE07
MEVETGLGNSWTALPYPVLVVDSAGVVVTVNDPVRTVLPGVSPGAALRDVGPEWLCGAHEVDEPVAVSGSVAGRDFDAHPVALPGGEVMWWLVEDTGRLLREAEAALARERERAALLAEASTVLMSSLNVDRCMAAAVRLAARHLADAAVLVAPAQGQRLPIVHGCADGSVRQRTVIADPDAVAGLTEALRGFPPVPSRWIDPASVPEWLIPDDFAGPVGSVVITPLPGHGVPAGALVLLRHTDQMAFSEGEEVFARLFAARAGAALSAARLYAEQAAITGTLMRDLLPPKLQRAHGVEFAGGYRASEHYEVIGGDFYDVHPARDEDGETLVALGDVCGKGLEAAVLTGKIRNTLHALTPMAVDHERVLRLLNSAMLSSHHTRFATLVLASVARRDGQVRLRLTCAGHPAPLIVRTDGRVETADTRGTLIGALPKISAQTFRTTLAPGETCLLYTDGVTEARGGPMGEDLFGEERLAAGLAECAGLPAEAVVERIQMLTSQWIGKRKHDDIAMVAITAPHRTYLSAVDGRTAGRYTA